MRYSALDLARLLDNPHPPTREQIAVIEAPLEPLLVVAGAGSGKTATMTDRVVWLVANELVAPSEILGLTFTRKAAAELATRVQRRLWRLARALPGADRLAAPRGAVAGDAGSGHAGSGALEDITERPVIATYNSFASALVSDHGIRIGLEADQRLLTEAGRFQVAMQVIEGWDADLVSDRSPATLAKAVVTLSGELAEHLLTPEQARRELLRIAEGLADAAPTTHRRRKDSQPYADVANMITSLRERADLMPLVTAFAEAKRAQGAMDFPDQVAAAAELARLFPAVGERERENARVVLLDEYQDTFVAQLQMLRGLFGQGHPVTAVGDPNQGIYGWRGASAGALLSFPDHFPRADGRPVAVANLATSWRNDVSILQAANVAAAPLRAAAGAEGGSERADGPSPAGDAAAGSDARGAEPGARSGTAVAVPALDPRPGALPGEVRWTFQATPQEEAAALAEAIAQRWRPGQGTAAVLCRKRAWFEPIREALTKRGLPAQVVGLAGLLHTPEVADVRAGLTAAFDPARGDALLRLLTGPAFRLGASDLMALQALAAERTGGGGKRGEPAEEPSIVEALDLILATASWTSRDGRTLTDLGRQRLAAARTCLREIRGMSHLALPDLVLATEQALGLDLELAAKAGASSRGRADLDAFGVVAAQFETGATNPSVGAFLAYLDAAEEYERGLDASAEEPDPDSVQILTMHAAKGLEWDVVAVAGLAEKDFPSLNGTEAEPTSSAWTTDVTTLPYELRGDRDHLPDLQIGADANHADVRDALSELQRADGERALREERRLAYVAFTRARSSLLLSGNWWSTRQVANTPSRFLREIVAAGLAEPLPGTAPDALAAGAPERVDQAQASSNWPVTQDPHLERQLELQRELLAAARTRTPAITQGGPAATGGEPATAPAGLDDPDPLIAEWQRQVKLLLAEQDAASHTEAAAPPQHLSASAVVALASDAAAFAQDRRRPVPQRPSTQARRGTQFHAWLEQHYQRAALLDVDDLDLEPIASQADLLRLQEAFLASPWAERVPLALEADVATPVAGVEVRCRIDAVFPGEPSADYDVHIVDWKTGEPPRGRDARQARELQLALYRLGWARLHGIPIERIAASFHYVGSGRTLSAPRLGEQEVTDLLAGHLAELAEVSARASERPSDGEIPQ